jgi:hypothetical protein
MLHLCVRACACACVCVWSVKLVIPQSCTSQEEGSREKKVL